jgi:hypothetical protein
MILTFIDTGSGGIRVESDEPTTHAVVSMAGHSSLVRARMNGRRRVRFRARLAAASTWEGGESPERVLEIDEEVT